MAHRIAINDCENCNEKNICEVQNTMNNYGFRCKMFSPYRPPSNADRIRAMTDEELAEFLEEQTSLAHNYGYECADGEPDFPDGIPANYDYLTWLKEEAKT